MFRASFLGFRLMREWANGDALSAYFSNGRWDYSLVVRNLSLVYMGLGALLALTATGVLTFLQMCELVGWAVCGVFFCLLPSMQKVVKKHLYNAATMQFWLLLAWALLVPAGASVLCAEIAYGLTARLGFARAGSYGVWWIFFFAWQLLYVFYPEKKRKSSEPH